MAQTTSPTAVYKPFENNETLNKSQSGPLRTKNIILFIDSLLWMYYGLQFMIMPTGTGKLEDHKLKPESAGKRAISSIIPTGAFTQIDVMTNDFENFPDAAKIPLIHFTRIFGLLCIYTGALNMCLVFNKVDISDENAVKAHKRRLNERFLYRICLNIAIIILQAMSSCYEGWPDFFTQGLGPRMLACGLVTSLPAVGLALDNPKKREIDYIFPNKIDVMGNNIIQS